MEGKFEAKEHVLFIEDDFFGVGDVKLGDGVVLRQEYEEMRGSNNEIEFRIVDGERANGCHIKAVMFSKVEFRADNEDIGIVGDE